MITVFPVLLDRRAEIPAVVHVDGTARPQIVTPDVNPRYYRLIKTFEVLTGVPVLLNTSFNVQEPIVCTPEDAVRTYLATDVDALVMENMIVSRKRLSGEPDAGGGGARLKPVTGTRVE